MAIPKVTAVCLSGVALLAGAEARLNSPTLETRAWIPIVDDILMSKMAKFNQIRSTTTTTHAPGPLGAPTDDASTTTTTTTRMPPMQFFKALAENVYLSKLLLAAEHGIHVPEQHSAFTNPIDLINNIPFPFSLVSNGLKRAAEAAGIDLDTYKKAIETNYENKAKAMIDHHVLPPVVLAQAVEELDPQTFMAFIPSLDQDYIQSLRQFLPANLAEIPSIHEVMGVFNVEQGTPAEATLRSLFPFFDIETLESYMRMASEGLPLPQIMARSEEEAAVEEDGASFRMWIPFLDEVLLSKYIPLLQNRSETEEAVQLPANYLRELSKFIPLPAPFTDLLGL